MSKLNRTKVRRETIKTMPSALPLGELAFNTETSELFVGTGLSKIKVNTKDFIGINSRFDTKANKKDLEELNVIFEEALANITNGNESSTNTEIVSARGGMPSLKLRINNMESASMYNTDDVVSLCTKIGYLEKDLGVPVSEGEDTNWKLSNFIKVTNTQGIYYDAFSSNNMASICLYDKSRKLIKTIVNTQKGLNNFIHIITFNEYENIGYIKVCYSATAKHKNIIFLFENTKKIKEDLYKTMDYVSNINYKMDMLSLCVNVGYITPKGVEVPGDNNWRYSNLKKIDFDCINIDVMSSANMSTLSFYDENNNFVGKITSSTTTSALTSKIHKDNFPKNAHYIRFCIATNEFLPYSSHIDVEYIVKESIHRNKYEIDKNKSDLLSTRNEISSLRLKVNNVESVSEHDTKDVIPMCTKIGFLDMSTGEAVGEGSDDNWKLSDYIEINRLQSLYYDACVSNNMASICLYDETKNAIKTFVVPQPSNGLFNYVTIIHFNEYKNAKYIRVCYSNTIKHDNIIFLFVNSSEVEKEIDKLNTLVKDITKTNALPLINNIGYISPTGVIHKGDNHWRYSDPIFIDFEYIDVDVMSSSNMSSIAFYDTNETFLGNITSDSKSASILQGNFKRSNFPEEAVYIRLCIATHEFVPYNKTDITFEYPIKEVAEKLRNDLQNATEKLKKDIQNVEEVIHSSCDLMNECNSYGYINREGIVTSLGDKNWKYSDFKLLNKTGQFNIKLLGHKLVSTLALYDSNKKFIVCYGAEESTSVTYEKTLNIKELPSNAVYFRICYGTALQPDINYHVTYNTNNIQDIKDMLHSSVDLVKLCTNFGYVNTSGIPVNFTDENWKHSDLIVLNKTGRIQLKLLGHKLVSTLAIYDSSKKFISSYGIKGSQSNSSVYELTIDVTSLPSQAKYFRICYGTQNSEQYSAQYDFERINALEEKVSLMEDGTKLDLSYIVPPKIYCTCNDTVSNLKGHNRNYKASIYLDHMICEDFNEEKHIRFKNGSDKLDLYSPIKVMDANESNPTVRYNEGVNILEKEIPIIITGKDVLSKEYKTKLISTLNSITKNVTPRVLCIGDSITYAELATIEDDGYSQNWAYHLMCKELFMKDRIDNGNTGHDIKFLGHFKKTRTMRYKNADYPITTFHEGIRGISLSQYLNGEVEDFKSPTTNKFSIKAWLDKYRTLDDNGNRLRVGNGTGTLINSGNINDIDVCTPTHILLMLSSNRGFTIEQYRELVAIIKNELPNVIIGLAVPDVASTHFPSLHLKCGENTYMWNSGHETGHSYTYHKQQYNCMKMLLEEYSNKENENIYIVPFFFVNPGAESSAMRTMYSMDSNFEIMKDNITIEQYGWVPNVHINAIGHSNWAYQLYSWLKYTIAKNI